MNWWRSTFASLEIAPFRVLWLGSLFSFVAFFMSTVVQSVVAFELTGVNRSVGLVVFGQGVAMFVLGPYGGALADRLSKRAMLLASQLVVCCVFAVLAVLLAWDAISVAALVGGSFAVGLSFSVLGPTRQAFVADLVPPELRGNAVALSQVANNASRVLGPGLAGALLSWPLLGAAGAYAVMSALYFGSIALLYFLPSSRGHARAHETSALGDVLEGVRYVARNRRLGVLVLYFIGVMMLGFPYVTVLPGFVENQLGRDATVISLLLLLTAVGALGASLFVARFADSAHADRLYTALGAVFGLTLIATALAPSLLTAALGMLAVGIGSGGFQTLNGAVVLRETEPAYFGRVMSLTMLAFAGFGLVGLPIGLLADWLGERVTLGGMGLAVCGVVAGMALWLRRLPTAPPVGAAPVRAAAPVYSEPSRHRRTS